MNINWHRLFGLFLIDFFTDSGYEVELEKDLSLKQQFLDVVILRKQHVKTTLHLPDGLDNLKAHNLLSYKSLHEPFDAWALNELIGHYVNYRKQVSPSLDNLLPEQDFQLYAVSTRFPRKLAKQVQLQPLKSGVYELIWGFKSIRMIVLSEILLTEHNAIWQLFSAKPKAINQASYQYHIHSTEMSSIILQLFEYYKEEKIIMSYTMQDFQKEYIRSHLDLLSPDEVIQQYSPDDRIKGLSPEDRIKGLSPDEVLVKFSSTERLKGLSLEEIETWLETQKRQSFEK